jgi:probable phosphoglycerate mutase
MQHVYFIRHGETQDNIDEVWPRIDVPLTDKGREQARKAGRDAKQQGLHFDLIISSTLPRAIETAQLVAAEVGYPLDRIETSPLLVERVMGDLTGASQPAYFNDTGRTYKDTQDAPGAEAIAAVQDRADATYAEIQARPEQSILVVSHGAFSRSFRRAVQGGSCTEEFEKQRPGAPPNATIIKLV